MIRKLRVAALPFALCLPLFVACSGGGGGGGNGNNGNGNNGNGNNNGGNDPVACATDGCTAVGATRCNDAGAVQTCELNQAQGCLNFTADTPCPAGESCSLGICAAGCMDECNVDGALRCDGDAVQTCGNFDDDECREWGMRVDCAQGETCSNGECSAGCEDECNQDGATECVAGAAVRTCGNTDDDECLEWGTPVNCAVGETCSGGRCDIGCSDECTAVGARECSGGGFRSCGNFDDDGCLEWNDVVNCGDGESCSEGFCRATFDCSNECGALDIKRCSQNAVQTCGNTDEDPCLEWGTPVACDEAQTCSSGFCVDGCEDECSTVGALRCEGNGSQSCGNHDEDPCLEWSTAVACPEGQSCSGGLCAVGCEDECTSVGARRCQENSVEQCGNVDDDPCREWSQVQTCQDGETCSQGACALTCENECDTAQAVRCEGDARQQCGNFDGDPCLEWGTPQNCAEGETCSNGICAPTCADECDQAGVLECAGGDATHTCGNFDGDPCLEWSTPQNCAEAETCSGGVCSLRCTDECGPAGSLGCSPGGTQRCGNFDSDACLEWSTASPCPEGETCSSGVCAAECTNECTVVGVLQCSGDGTQRCGNFDADPCLEWSSITTCAEGLSCSGGVCEPRCNDECMRGEMRCQGAGVVTCGEFDTDDCSEWGGVVPCAEGETCSDGVCAQTCTDECMVVGALFCDGNSSRECGNFDTDDCLELGTPVPCPDGHICNGGACEAGCVDECEDGAIECRAGIVEGCDDVNMDGCLEWFELEVCGPDAFCQADACASCTADSFEPNQTLDAAAMLGAGEQADLTLCPDDEDWYAVALTGGQTLRVDLLFEHDDGDIDLTVSNAAGVVLTSSAGTGDEESVSYGTDVDITVYVRVYGFALGTGPYIMTTTIEDCTNECEREGERVCQGAATAQCGQFDEDACLELDAPVPCGADEECFGGTCSACADQCDMDGASFCQGRAFVTCGQLDSDSCLDLSAATACAEDEICAAGGCLSCVPDMFEDNPDAMTAAAITAGDFADLTLCPRDEDWYSFDLTAGESIVVTIDFAHEDGDLDLALLDATGAELNVSTSVSDSETVTHTATADETVFIQVFGFLSSTGLYSMSVGAGACEHDCTTAGEATCAEGGVVTCGFLDEDACLDLSEPVACGAEEDCNVDRCEPCQDECNEGELRCSGNEVLGCGNTDGDSCREFVSDSVCGANQQCVNGGCTDCPPDGNEPNDDTASATRVGSGVHGPFGTCTDDEDFFVFDATQDEQITVRIEFTHADGDIDMALLDGTGLQLESSASTEDFEQIQIIAPSTGDYFIQVFGFGGAVNSYSLSVDVGPVP